MWSSQVSWSPRSEAWDGLVRKQHSGQVRDLLDVQKQNFLRVLMTQPRLGGYFLIAPQSPRPWEYLSTQRLAYWGDTGKACPVSRGKFCVAA